MAERTAHSPAASLAQIPDPVRRARLLRRIHDRGPGVGAPSPLLRPLVARSWQRSAAAGSDPDRPAPRILDSTEAAERLETWPFASVLPPIAAVLGRTLRDSRCLAVLSDCDGLILWSDGDPDAMRIAERVRFVPGALCSETAIGTNAVGTALALDHAVQIFSAEHYNRLLHSWACAAAPIHDPATGALLGAIDVSGDFRSAHLHSLGLVQAIARLAEAELGQRTWARAERLKTLYVRRVAHRVDLATALLDADGRVVARTGGGWMGTQTRVEVERGQTTLANGAVAEIEPLGRTEGYIAWAATATGTPAADAVVRLESLGRARLRAYVNGRPLEFGPRQGALLLLLALNPEGLARDEIGARLYGPEYKAVTVRAEISRLRARVGPLVRSAPYRLEAELHIDAEELIGARMTETELRALWRGGPLPSCVVPEIAAWRQQLARRLFGATG